MNDLRCAEESEKSVMFFKICRNSMILFFTMSKRIPVGFGKNFIEMLMRISLDLFVAIYSFFHISFWHVAR